VSEDGTTITHRGDKSEYVTAIMQPIMQGKEEHEYSITIVHSRYNDGGGMLIGFTDTNGAGKAWGLLPMKGHLYSVRNAKDAGSIGKQMTGKDLSSQVKGAVIKVVVNMEKRTVFYAINGEPPVGADVELPENVQMWARLTWPGDTLMLSNYESPEARLKLQQELENEQKARASAEQQVEQTQQAHAALAGKHWLLAVQTKKKAEQASRLEAEIEELREQLQNERMSREQSEQKEKLAQLAAVQLQGQVQALQTDLQAAVAKAGAHDDASAKANVEQIKSLQQEVTDLKKSLEEARAQSSPEAAEAVEAAQEQLEHHLNKRAQAQQDVQVANQTVQYCRSRSQSCGSN